jgi:hypothetical protein
MMRKAGLISGKNKRSSDGDSSDIGSNEKASLDSS